MKTTIILGFIVSLLSVNVMASTISDTSVMGEVETDCPWAKQDDRSADISAKLQAARDVEQEEEKTISQ